MNLVKITLLSPFHKYSKERELALEFEKGENFGDLIKKMIKKFGNEFKETLLDENNKIADWITVMRGGENISSKPGSGFSEPLADNQEYVFCAFISGGA